MAHFEKDGTRISKQKLSVLRGEALTIGLWGAMNQLVKPPQELDVAAVPADRVKLERSSQPITGAVRKWKINGLLNGATTIQAKARSQTWDSFELEVYPPSYKFLQKVQREFITNLAAAGRAKAKEFDYPLSAMIACGCGESTFGTSSIFKRTGCPFNIQKPDDWEYPKCETESHSTENKQGETAKPAPFCKAKSLADAARIWCEWIHHWPNASARDELLKLRKNPAAFAEHLFRVGFADSKRDRTIKFRELLELHELKRFDS